MSPEHYFNDKSGILLHPGTRCNKNFASQKQNYAQKMQDAQVTKSLHFTTSPFKTVHFVKKKVKKKYHDAIYKKNLRE